MVKPVLKRCMFFFNMFILLTSEHNQAKAPLSVPEGAATQQDLLVVQWELLSIHLQVSRKLVQTVVRGLAMHLT